MTNGPAHTIEGHGTISVPLVNNGTVLANAPGETLTLNGGSVTNHGLMSAGDGGQLLVITPVGGTGGWLADGGTVRVESATIATSGPIEVVHGGRLELAGASMAGENLRVGGADEPVASSLSADAGSRLELTGDFGIHVAAGSPFDLSAATVVFAGAGTGGEPQHLEVAGLDRGLDPNGWVDNFAIGRLEIGPAARVRLLDVFESQAAAGGSEALYVDWIVFEPGGGIDLNGLAVYYRNGGEPKRLFRGDFDVDGDVDRADLLILTDGIGADTGAGWLDGDSDGDGDVDAADYLAWKTRVGLPVGGGELPEPGGVSLLGIGVLALLRRRRGRNGLS